MSGTETMGPSSDTTHEEENGHLSVKQSSSCDAATQTPQMTRHAATPTRRTHHAHASYKGSSSSEESLTYEDSMAYHPHVKNASTHLAMPIPDVVIEHSNDTSPLTREVMYSSSSPQQPRGFMNLAFDGKEEMARSSFTGSFRERPNAYHSGGPVLQQHNQHVFVSNGPSDQNNQLMANFDRRVYYSLPKDSAMKRQTKDLQLRSQPPTPQMKREEATPVTIDSSNFWIIPREHSSNSLNTMLSQSPKYAQADSVSGLYSISGRSTAVSNGFSEPVIGLYEMNLMPPMETPASSTPRSVRKFEFTKMSASVDRKRRRLQWWTDSLSLLLIIPGIIIAFGTPALVLPLFYVGPKLFIPYVLVFLATGTLSAVFLTFAGIVGNVVWYYDEDTKKLRPRMHCGKGPTFHFWGNGFYTSATKEKEVTV